MLLALMAITAKGIDRQRAPATAASGGGEALQAHGEPALHVGPFAGEDRVAHGVAQAAVGTALVGAQHAIAMRAEAFDRALRIEVAVVGMEFHRHAVQRGEGVPEQQALAGGVEVALLPALRVPGIADRHARQRRVEIVVAGGADDLAVAFLAHCERQRAPRRLAGESGGDVVGGGARRRRAGEPQLPQLAVGGGRFQRGRVRGVQRFEQDVVVLQVHRGEGRHAGRRSGVEVGNELAFQPRNGVLQQQLALLQAGDLQLVARAGGRHLGHLRIQRAVFAPQFGQRLGDRGQIRGRHGECAWKKATVYAPGPARVSPVQWRLSHRIAAHVRPAHPHPQVQPRSRQAGQAPAPSGRPGDRRLQHDRGRRHGDGVPVRRTC